MKRSRFHAPFVAGLLVGLVVALVPATALASIRLGDILKVGGWVYILKNHADEIDDGINKVVGRHDLDSEGMATKVVPIVSVGQGGFIGAAQVSGPTAKVNATKAALQIEAALFGRDIRARILIPIDATNPLARFKRVDGVGTTALLDLRL